MKVKNLLIVLVCLFISSSLKAKSTDTTIIKTDTKGEIVQFFVPPFDNARVLENYPESTIVGNSSAYRECSTNPVDGVISQKSSAEASWLGVAGIATSDGIRSGPFSVEKTGPYLLRIKGFVDGDVIEGSSASTTGVSKSGGKIWIKGGIWEAWDEYILYETDFSEWAFIEEATWAAIKVACEQDPTCSNFSELIDVIKDFFTPKISWNNEPFELYSYGNLLGGLDYYWELHLLSSVSAGAVGWAVNEVAVFEAMISNLSMDLIYLGDDTYNNTPPILSNPQVNPSDGDESTEYKFSVYYYDANGDAPLSGEAKLNLFGQENKTLQMSLESGFAHNGIYSCTTTLQIGQYYHRFYFLNSSNQEVVTDILYGPSVHNSSNLTIIPHLECGTNENYEIYLGYKINDVSYPGVLLKVGENNGIEVPPGGNVQLSVSTKGNYTFDKYRMFHDGELEWESGNITVIFYFTDFAAGIYDLYIDFTYTPLNLLVSGTINTENNTLYDGTINLNLLSSQQNLSLEASNGLFSFENVKGGVPIKVEASGAPVGYDIHPEKISVSNFWRDETDLRFTVSADDFIAPTIQLIHYPDLQSSLSDITFSWIGEDDVTIEESLEYSYKLEGFDVSWSPLSNIKTVNYSLPNGIYKFVVKAWDQAGNSSNVPVEYSFIVNANPKIDNIEKFEKSLWASEIIISTDGSTISENRIVLLPEHSLTNIESIIPVRLYRLNEKKPCGSNQIIAETLNLDTVFISQNGEFIFNIPDEFPESNKLEYIIEWGKKCNFGWQESKSIPKGFPNLTDRGQFNSDITEDKYLDENHNLWRLATMNKKITTDDQNINNSWTYFDKANTNEVLINEKEVEYIEGSWISGERYTWMECSYAKLIPIRDKQYVVIQERKDERTYPEGTFLDSYYVRYVIKVIDQNGSLINSLNGEWKDHSSLYPLPEFAINNNIWITSIKKERIQRENNFKLSFSVVDENCNILADNVEFYSANNYEDVDNEGVFPIGSDKAILFFEEEYKTALKKDRQNLCFQIRDNIGTLEKPTSTINSILDESIDVMDTYRYEDIITDNLGRVWVSYRHYRSGDGEKFYYVVLNSNGQIIHGPVQTSNEMRFRICDKDNYIWANIGSVLYLIDHEFNKITFPGFATPNQKVGDKMARVLYYDYTIFDRWSPITFAVDLSSNHRNDTLEIFDLPINEEVGVRNLVMGLNNTNILSSNNLPESSKLKVSEEMQLGTNIFTMTQDHLLGGNVLITFPIVVNYPPTVLNPITDKVIMEDYGDSLLVDNLNLVFNDQNGDILTYSISSSGNSITISVIGSVIQVTTINNMFGLNEVVVTASDGTYSIRDTFNIAITPVNDTPIINDQVFSIKENSPNGTIVDTVLATDVDVNDILNYTITNGNTNNAFAINAFNGEIIVNDYTQLDYETDSTFVLTVQVQDNGTGYLTDDATVNIAITPVNDAPVINDQVFSIKENSPNGTIVDTVIATDADANDTLSYTITYGNTGNAFAINTSNGEITVSDSSQLDYETDSIFVLTVQVQDNGIGYLTNDAAITINLINEVETLLNYPPTVQNSIDDKVIKEDYGDSLLVDNLNLVFGDQDGDILTYSVSLSGNSITISVIDSVIQVSTIKDMFGLNEVVIIASDGIHSVSDTFNIAITPVNDAPVINDQVFSIKENSPNGTIVDTVLATDADINDILSYMIINGNTINAFVLNTFKGEIIVNDSTQLDYETDSTFVLTIQAQDNGTGYLTDNATITINLINEVETLLEGVRSNDFIKIYPNPAREFLTIKIENIYNEKILIEIINVSGKTSYKNQLWKLSYKVEEKIDISNYTKGVYFIKIISESTMRIDKLIID